MTVKEAKNIAVAVEFEGDLRQGLITLKGAAVVLAGEVERLEGIISESDIELTAARESLRVAQQIHWSSI